MFWLEPIEAVSDFLETGGGVLLLIFAITFVMWMLMLERIWYYRRSYPEDRAAVLGRWEERKDQTSWSAHQIRRQMISEIQLKLDSSLLLIKTLVGLCPLLGLLGTVTGMIEVFDVMAIAGSGNARAMASGVSKATIPTMAGMVAALSGLILSVQLERFANDEAERVADQMVHH